MRKNHVTRPAPSLCVQPQAFEHGEYGIWRLLLEVREMQPQSSAGMVKVFVVWRNLRNQFWRRPLLRNESEWHTG
ncbi:hypothetical protein [Novipirellula maiorica]|uniref:hypothetical protein n=1 Tax=Novipirellula maiorica TaxID=1265734 RepID=UPI00118192B3|nr:hypothetical protein [Rhodopirellula maiorica]